MIFSQTPVEASLWTMAVSIQQMVSEIVTGNQAFHIAVSLFAGILFVKAITHAVFGRFPVEAFTHFGVSLTFMCLGLLILATPATSAFSPVSSEGRQWKNYPGVAGANRTGGLRGERGNGLLFYRLIQGSIDGISRFTTTSISAQFGNEDYDKSPFLFYQTLAKTAGATLTEPAHIESFTWLLSNCQRTTPVAAPDTTASFSAVFDLSRSECRSRYDSFLDSLRVWSQERTGTDLGNSLGLALEATSEFIGMSDRRTLENKRIASALVNTMRSMSGSMNSSNVNSAALLADDHPLAAQTGASAWVATLNSMSLAGAVSPLSRNVFGLDVFGADVRNEMAWIYNRMVQFLPPIRGFAKGILAIAFVVAATALAFGFTGPFVGWLGASAVWAAYEPVSTLIYHIGLEFTSAQQNVEAITALSSDPLVLGGAAIVDANIARVQAVYFIIQLGVAIATAWAGIAVFNKARNIGNGASGFIVSRAIQATQITRGAVR